MGQSKPIGSDTILIVEDEAIVRFELIDLFEEEGYRTFAAATTGYSKPLAPSHFRTLIHLRADSAADVHH